MKGLGQWCQNASYFVMCSLKFDSENYFYKLVHGLNLVKKKQYILYSAHFGTHFFLNLVYTLTACPVILTTTKAICKFLCLRS
jgi:hypothetical protein